MLDFHKNRMVNLLSNHPSKYSEDIASCLGVPIGNVRFLLKINDEFVTDQQGRWSLRSVLEELRKNQSWIHRKGSDSHDA